MNLPSLFAVQIDLPAAFLAGLLTFLTPCILPLVPAWLVLVSGLGYEELSVKGPKKSFFTLFRPTLAFVLGFMIIFSLFGAGMGLLGEILADYSNVIRILTGILMIAFGLILTGLLPYSFLTKEFRLNLTNKPLGLTGAFLVGMGFAVGWSPCVGPVLAGILAMAAMEGTAWQGAGLLLIYGLGLAIPFLLLSLFWGPGLAFISKIKRFTRYVGIILGFSLILLGLNTLFFS